ncbi:Hypothetical predicted protein [Paramuricea clavata]|uniref:Uncharacterized protein n=1 Tax=Paramuricea clavata TaxID=317549 RepID=A0A6S7JVX6_PARCT|nr:Hypothetical predicted protein [Paramuricea clavata]
METFKAVIERRSPFSIKLLNRRYVAIHLERIKSLLNREDAIASRLDMGTYRQYVNELEHNWDNNIYIGCCMLHKENHAEKPIALAIASASAYRANVRRPMGLNWRRTDAYRQKEQQWCLDYLVRASEFRGRGVGCFGLVGLLECFCSRFDDWMLWLLLASATETRFLCTQVLGFLSRRSTLTRIPSCHYKSRTLDRESAERAAAAEQGGAEQGGGDGGDGGGDGDGGGGRPPYNLQRGGRQFGRRGDGRQRCGHRNDLVQEVEPRLCFRTMEQLTLSKMQLVLPPRAEGLEQDLVRHLWSMSEMAALNPGSQAFLIHLNLAKQCHHHIAHQRRLHMSRWITEQTAENREDEQWNRRFASLANNVLLLWGVFTMPCLELLDIGYAAASRPGGLKDIVRLCRKTCSSGTDAQLAIGNGDGLREVTILRTRGWLDDGDVEVDEALSTLLWQNIERKTGRCEQLPGTRHRYRIVGYDTQELLTCAGCSTASRFTEKGEEEFSGRHSSINIRFQFIASSSTAVVYMQ